MLNLTPRTVVTMATTTIALLIVSGCARDGAGSGSAAKVSRAQVPPAVMEAVEARFPGADVVSIERETEQGKVIYDLELKHEGRKYEMDVNADGTVAEVESEIAAGDLPPAVSKAVNAKYPDATLIEVLEKRKGTEQQVHEYEVVVRTAEGKRELTLSPEGTVTEEDSAD